MPKDPRAPQKIGDKTVSHLRFNDIADYYNIEKLAKLSTGKIDLILKKEVDFFIIPRIIDEMSTSNRDAVLRSLIVSATARYIEELTSSQVLPTIDLEHHVTIEILEACGERIQQLMSLLSVLAREVLMFFVAQAVCVAIDDQLIRMYGEPQA
ncbi:hypothetical protein BFJ63_vAg3264 [Fusarium oxysporum f. sp. narcissi]|uniref:Uncharacterized protein n=1 Tax=Fusarium oxysporum f. sp. narcissi TaxID=451672 RepID=A0A4Q2W2X5_FUSOX|nr:hypothetical protein BFJ66_g7882 [Fusarium oxysporum f. sp. cepae]RYC93967.1 hypothetical protein BFJ63_vAg3264 [Fusarium oxysporum f. sp. narcissi]